MFIICFLAALTERMKIFLYTYFGNWVYTQMLLFYILFLLQLEKVADEVGLP